MEITIFKEITTEGVITSIEENSKKYHEGFYADMNNLPERKLVKESAAEIGNIIKALKTSRIAITKANTAAVNKEHDAIVLRLEAANKPFTSLIDTYNIERKKVLDAEKAKAQSIIDAEKKELDHEIALLINKTYEFDKAESARIKEEEHIKMQKIADERAIEQQRQIALADESDRVNAENARLANKEHVRKINTDILFVLVGAGISEDDAKKVITLAAKRELPNLVINY